MTDATAGRGGVGIRLFVQGGEVVRRTFDQVGDSGRKMWAEIAVGGQRVNPALRALSAGSNEVRGAVDGLAGRAGVAGTILGNFGAAGVAAAAGLGGLAVALVKTREAMEFAATLTDTADRIGTGVTELQAWRFVADEAGVSTSSLEGNLEKLNGVLGAFKAGIGDGKLKPVFEALGITKDQLSTVQSADQMLLILADTLGQVQDRALQVKFARSLGVEESLPILRLGADGIRALTGEAERLGLVMGEDVVSALDAADRQMEVAQQRIDMSLRLAVSGLADDFADVITAIAGAVGMLARWNDQVQRMGGRDGSRPTPRGVLGMVSDSVRGRTGAEGDRARDEGIRNQPGWMRWLGFGGARGGQLDRQDAASADLRSSLGDLAAGRGEYAAATPGFERATSGGGGKRGGGGADKASREAEQRAQRFQRVSDQIDRLSMDIEKEMNGQFRSIEESAAIAQQVLSAEAAQRDLVIQRGVEEYARTEGLRGISETEAATLREKEALLLAAQHENARQVELRDLSAYRLRQEEASVDEAIAMLGIEAELATTQAERSRIEREILIATQEIARKRKRAALESDPNLDTGQIDAAMAALDRQQAGDRTVFDVNEANRVRETFKSAGREVVQAIQDGRIGEYIGDKLKERLLDGALSALFDAIGSASKGGKGGSGGGFWGSLLNFGASLFTKGGGKASGGDVKAGFQYRAAEHGPELFMLGGQGQVTSAAETVKMLQGMGGGAGSRGESAGVSVSATYAPNISVQGSGPEIDALRRELSAERANFRSNVVDTVNDAISRRQIGG